ncbi:MAG: sigma-70 family RNA polymerase sigma factor, partial [Planctomycetes bacterium]|nr:sigma-70 family RNA polymerase sigma factor [Planctomycetota bacterium]
ERAVARDERDRGVGPAAAAELAEEASYVRSLLTQLSPQLRETLSLRYLDELSLKEVAGVLGCPSGTVSSRIRRGLAQLRESFENAGEAVPAPMVGLGALGMLTILRGVVAPPAASAGQLLSQAASLAPIPELLAAPEGPLGAALAGAVAGGAPPPPAPNEVLSAAKEAAQGALESSPQAAATLAPLAIVLVALALGGGAVGLLLSETTPTPLASSSSPQRAVQATPSGSSPTAPAQVAALGLRGALIAPHVLQTGDKITAQIGLEWTAEADLGYSGEDLTLSAKLVDVENGALSLRVGGSASESGALRWPLDLRAHGPGSARLLVSVQRGAEPVFQGEAVISVQGRQRPVELVQNVNLEGPEGQAQITLDPRVAQLEAPRKIFLRVIPGLAAEATLSLRGLAHQPTGCFEQTTAATYPSALVLALGEKNGASPSILSEANEHATTGAKRLRRFQSPRGFSLHPGEAADPWLTALGLRQLSRLAAVIKIDSQRLDRAAEALVGWQRSDGSFPIGKFVAGRAPKGHLAVNSTACEALAAYLQRPGQEEAPAVKEALERGLDWLVGEVPNATANVERAYLARAFLVGDRVEEAEALLPHFLAKAQRPGPELAYWAGEWSLTGGGKRVATIETTALVVQTLSGLDQRELVRDALAWLAKQRGSRGFGGTQATIMALEAFLAGGSRQAEGVLTIQVGGSALRPLKLEKDLQILPLGERPSEQEALFVEALKRGLSLSFRGTGNLNVQVVAKGEVPYETAWGRNGVTRAKGANQLEVEVARPLEGHVGTPQRWHVRARNRGRNPIASPMVQLNLPPGFQLEAQGRKDLDLELENKRIRAWELNGPQSLVLYMLDLPPGAQAKLSFRVVPRLAGEFGGGSLEAYPYYRADGVVASALPRTRIAPAFVIAVAVKPPPLAPVRTASPVRKPRPKTTPTASKPETGLAPAAPLTIAWLSGSLGRLKPKELDLAFGAGPGERLLARALAAFPGANAGYQETPGADAQVLLPVVRWSDGRPVTVENYLTSIRAAASRFKRGRLPLLAPLAFMPVSGQTVQPQPGAGRALTWALPADTVSLLSSAPYAATPPEGSKPEVRAGPYRYEVLKEGRIRLRPRGSGRIVDIVQVKHVRPEETQSYDLIWGAPQRSEPHAEVGLLEPDLARSLRPRGKRPFHVVLTPPKGSGRGRREISLDVSALALPSRLEGRPLTARINRLTLVLPADGYLLVNQRALVGTARRLREACKRVGVTLKLVNQPDGLPEGKVATLYATPGFGEGQVLASYDSLLRGGRLVPGAALDHNGFLVWPPPVSEPYAPR